MAAELQCTVPEPRVPLILVGRVFIVLDDGASVASDYLVMERIILKEVRSHPRGMACLTIIPPNAKPPREEIRTAIRQTIGNVSQHLAAVCWHIEGSGFKAAAARAVLSGLLLILNPPYPSHITSELREALAWSFKQVGVNPDDPLLVQLASRISELRPTLQRTPLQHA
jgi:hypothetical protein